jgi:uncharacterized DUF497 family protein
MNRTFDFLNEIEAGEVIHERRRIEVDPRRGRRTVIMEFEWDPKKSAANARKHDVRFQEASTVFGDSLAMTFADPDHSNNERRYLTFGLSKYSRLLVVAHTDRGEKTRIISARLMDRKERRIYEEG